MTTEDLIEYIKSQINKNIPKDLIASNLLGVGWHKDDIDEGFSQIEKSNPSSYLNKEEEIIKEVPFEVSNASVVETPVETSSFTPITLNKEEPVVSNIPEGSAQRDYESQKKIDPYRELPDDSILNNDYIKEVNKVETPIVEAPVVVNKVWVPTTIKPKVEDAFDIKQNKEEPVTFSSKTEIEPYLMEVGGSVSNIQSSNPVVDAPIKVEEKLTPKIQEKDEFVSSSNINRNPFMGGEYQIRNSNNKPAENFDLIPTLNKNGDFEIPASKSVVSENKIPAINPSAPVMSDILPKNAMIASYSQDILSANKEQEVVSTVKKISFMRWAMIALVVIFIGGMIFAFVEGYIKIPWSNFSFSIVKKDPRNIILNSPSVLSNLNSYKVDTDLSLSSPSLSSITTGLSSGEAINSKDRDSVSLSTKGLINRIEGKSYFDYSAIFKSSILEKDISSNWKYDGNKIILSIPDLTEILGKDAPDTTNVSLLSNQTGTLIEEIYPSLRAMISGVDSYNIANGEVPLYVKNEVSSILANFIKNLEFAEKGKEVIRGVDTYHYEMIADRQVTKELLSSFVDLFITKISAEQKKVLDEGIGASTIKSFDVWVGKNDNNLYQIKLSISTPLSKVLGLNDSGIAGNEVVFDWSTTYYDFDISNDIKMPQDSITLDEFTKNTKEIKIKNIMSSFGSQANSLKNTIGSFGSKSNSSGSCTSPSPSSLFSPSGHAKSADGAISLISSSMNTLLALTNGTGSCYSSSKAWALQVPISVENNSFYCVDNTGKNINTTLPLSGTICK